MKVAFTICSNNYLAQAKVLGDSLTKYNPDYKFIIGLTDRYSAQIIYEKEFSYEFICIEDIGILNINELWEKYNIIELNTCVKPVFFRHLFNKYSDIEFLFYFDPDICIYDRIYQLEINFEVNDFILTPHILFPLSISDERPNEQDFLNYGIFNIGFLGLKRTEQILNRFIPWWEERTLNLGYIKPEEGLFVDQIWFNIVPLFFKKVCILTHPGCNMAPWNLNERELMENSGTLFVNGSDRLIFFHFSSFKYKTPDIPFTNYNRNLNKVNSALRFIYKEYNNILMDNNVEKYSEIPCCFYEQRDPSVNVKVNTSKINLKKLLKNLLPYFLVNAMHNSNKKMN